jgi:hypothetical protein
MKSGLLSVATLAALTATAAAAASTGLSVDVKKNAGLVEGGQAVELRLRAACPAGEEVLEAFVYVTQEGNESDFASIPLICDGKKHTFIVRASSFDTPFHRGPAQASPFVLLTSGASISPAEPIKLR